MASELNGVNAVINKVDYYEANEPIIGFWTEELRDIEEN